MEAPFAIAASRGSSYNLAPKKGDSFARQCANGQEGCKQ